MLFILYFFFSSRIRHTRCALVTGVQTCALPIFSPPIALLRKAVENTANLAASYMAAGFVHGVLNSDNINVTGESFDYGPWRFTPRWEPGFTAAYFDPTGLYAFGRQAEAIHRSEEHTSELQSQMRISYAVLYLK